MKKFNEIANNIVVDTVRVADVETASGQKNCF